MKKILDDAKNGVILVSWGSNIKSASIPDTIQQEMLKGFAKLKQQIIWKWEDESINEIASENVYATSWLPQQDILCNESKWKSIDKQFNAKIIFYFFFLN